MYPDLSLVWTLERHTTESIFIRDWCLSSYFNFQIRIPLQTLWRRILYIRTKILILLNKYQRFTKSVCNGMRFRLEFEESVQFFSCLHWPYLSLEWELVYHSIEHLESQVMIFLARPSSAPSWWPRSAPRGGFWASIRFSMFTLTILLWAWTFGVDEIGLIRSTQKVLKLDERN